jgi:hypothetical protein
MKMKSILGVLFLIVGAAVALAATPPDQPLMVAARADLNKAKTQLQLALHDKGGHRAKAVGLVNSAIAEVNAGIAFDRRHNHAVFAMPDQPHMQSALDALQSAKTNLQNATADKGGHRVKALEFVNAAIDEVNAGIAAGAN